MKRIPWPSRDEPDGETEELLHLVHNGWCWEWPGWQWVANRLNDEFGNNRTAAACRSKFESLERELSEPTQETA